MEPSSSSSSSSSYAQHSPLAQSDPGTPEKGGLWAKLMRKKSTLGGSPQLERQQSRSRMRSMSLQTKDMERSQKPKVSFADAAEKEAVTQPDKPFYVYEPTEINIDPEAPPPVTPVSGYRTEYPTNVYNLDNINLADREKHMPFYKLNFEGQHHIVFVGGDDTNPFVGAVLLMPEEAQYRTILWAKNDTYHRMLPIPKSKKFIKDAFKQLYAAELKDAPLTEVKESEIVPLLVNMEDRMLVKHYCFGVIYAKSGQSEEEEMFGNKDDDTSRPYKDFLNFLGDKVKLEGFPGPKCGLDTKTNTTGTHTYYTRFAGFEIVYHVATLLPHSDVNPQQVEKKRHLGNDVIMIIFVDGADTMINPEIFHTKFTHVFAVIQHVKDENDKSRYRIAIANKPGVREYGPAVPDLNWKLGPGFREFLLTKLINGERAAYYAPGFAQARTRRMWLADIVKKYERPEK